MRVVVPHIELYLLTPCKHDVRTCADDYEDDEDEASSPATPQSSLNAAKSTVTKLVEQATGIAGVSVPTNCVVQAPCCVRQHK